MSENTDNTEVIPQDELTTLKARADKMGISYHPSIGVDKLRDKVAAVLAGTKPADPAPGADVIVAATLTATPSAPPVETVAAPQVETEVQRRKRLKLEAMALVRIRLSCMNPAKKEWDGEIITVGNRLVGTVRKYIPFNADEGWHVPRIMYEVLKDKQCQVFVSSKSKNGVTQREGRLIKEFAIEVLPDLTPAELQEMARRQAMTSAAD